MNGCIISMLKLTGNLSPYIENDPVPSPLMKSPPAHRDQRLAYMRVTGGGRTLAHEVWDAGSYVSFSSRSKIEATHTLYNVTGSAGMGE